MSKKPKIFWLILWSSMCITFTNCIFYKTVTVPVSHSTLSQYLDKKQIWTIRDADHRTDGIYGIVIRNDSLFGKLSSGVLPDHPENKRSYRKEKGENSKDYMHLLTNSPEFSGNVKLPISEITSATTHETDKEKTILVNVLLLLLILSLYY